MVDGPISKRKITRRMKRNAILAGAAFLLCLTIGVTGWKYFSGEESSSADVNSDVLALSAAARPLAQSIASFFETISKELVDYAASEATKSLFLAADEELLEQEQNKAVSQFLSAIKLRLILPGQFSVDNDSTPPLTFGSIAMLNKAERSTGSIAIEALMFGTENQHIVMVERVKNQADQIIGIVHLSLDVDLFQQALMRLDTENAYLEIRQAVTNNPLALGNLGDPGMKSGEPGSASIAGTRWTLSYWSQPNMMQANLITNNSFNTVLLTFILLIFAICTAGYVLNKRKAGSSISSVNKQNISYEGAVKEIMEGAHPGVEKLIANLPGVKNVATHTSGPSKELVGEDITSMVTKEDLKSAESLDDVFDISKEASDEATIDKPENKPKEQIAVPETSEPVDDTSDIPQIIFRKYDIRGIVDKVLTSDIVYKIGLAVGSEADAAGIKTIVVGRDGRNSSPDLAKSLISGFTAAGRDVIDIGIVPTPILYYATHFLETGSGVMVTGSHNGPEYNGLKIVLDGTTLSEDRINDIYNRIKSGKFSAGSGTISTTEIIQEYVRRVTEDIPVSFGNSFKLVIDCGNGAASVVAAQLFRAMGHDVIELFCELDGNFPNHHPDPGQPENLEHLINKVKEEQADLGFAFDGDGDRLGVVDSEGNIIWPDRQMMVFARDVLSRNQGAEIIFDVKCSSHLKQVIESSGGKALMWKTGHSLIKSKMKEVDAPLAGEMSGHIFFAERWYGFDDALYSGARLLEILTNSKVKPVDFFAELPGGVSTPELKIDMPESEHTEFMTKLASKISFDEAEIITIDGFRVEFSDGWGLIRPSNTTPCLVARFEADNADALARVQGKFKELIQSINPDLAVPF
ncbi:MAG: phosphomannomutase/phosphoglucomutase [Gammaproteobacteria bacterium]|jgi:phosphomannomutase/phosphoglucomutase